MTFHMHLSILMFCSSEKNVDIFQLPILSVGQMWKT